MYLSEFFKAALVPMGVFPTEVDVTEKMMVPESVGQGKLDTMSPLEVEAAFHRRLRSLHSSQRTPTSSKKTSLATRLQFATPPAGNSKYRFLMLLVSLQVHRAKSPSFQPSFTGMRWLRACRFHVQLIAPSRRTLTKASLEPFYPFPRNCVLLT